MTRALASSGRGESPADRHQAGARLKVLLSAFACRPGIGSEGGIGWNWAVGVARLGHATWVITPVHYRDAIEAALASPAFADIRDNITFVYCEVPARLLWLKITADGTRNRVYHLVWQWHAYRLARMLHSRIDFDLVHHVSFGSITHPTFMGGLGIPFILGPAGGGERAPLRLRYDYGLRGHLFDALRDLRNLTTRWHPAIRSAWRRADLIYVTSESSARLVPTRWQSKIRYRIATGTVLEARMRDPRGERHSSYDVLYAGRIVFWKGIGLLLACFAELLAKKPDARLTIVGRGRDEARFRRRAEALGIKAAVTWTRADSTMMPTLYARHDVFLFPSLHDSGGTVVLEAMWHGLPVVCLDLGGPGLMVDESCGRRIATGRKSAQQVVSDLSAALIELSDPALRRCLGDGARIRAERFSWPRNIRAVYGADLPVRAASQPRRLGLATGTVR